MAVVLAEALQADGSFTIDVDYRPDIADALVKGKTHVLLYEGANIIAREVLTGVDPSRDGIKITARSLSYLLGSGSDGPTILSAEFVAGTNRLLNGDFELFGADALDILGWTIAKPGATSDRPGSLWLFTGAPLNGNYAAVMLGNPVDDDPITSDSWAVTNPTATWEVSAMIARGATTLPGRVRLRIVFEGKYLHPDQFQLQYAQYDLGGPSLFGDINRTLDPYIPGTVLKMATVQHDVVQNPSFNAGLTGWVQAAGTWTTVTGPDGWVARTAFTAGDPFARVLTADNAYYPTSWFNVTAGEEYFYGGWISQEANTDGIGILTCKVVAFPADATKPDFSVEIARKGGTAGDLGWYYFEGTFTIPDGYNLISPTAQAHGNTTGAWLYDNIHLRRTKGNIDTFTGPLMVVAPKRTYRWSTSFRSTPGTTGSVQLRMVASSAGRTPVISQGPLLVSTTTDGGVQTISFDYTVPSGYDAIQYQAWCQDVYGGSFFLGLGTLSDTDTATVVGDTVPTFAPTTTQPYKQLIQSHIHTPPGTTAVHLEVIAEADAFGYTVDQVSVRRDDVAPWPARRVVAALLQDPHTTSPVLTLAGDLGGPPIAFDWVVKNQVMRDALTTLFTTGFMEPPWEWRVNGPARTFAAGPPNEVFADRTDVILRRGQLRLLNVPQGSSTIDKVVDEVRVVGAERTAADGSKTTISAAGSLTNPTTYDAFGRALRQTRTVVDSSIDDYFHAALRVSYELALAQPTAPSVSVEITDPRAWGTFDVGDTIYPYDPDAGLVGGTEMADPDTGEPIWPMPLRVIDRSSTYAQGSRRIELVDPATQQAGEGLDITDAVRWSDKTTQALTLGVPKPEFISTAGGNPGQQLLRFILASRR